MLCLELNPHCRRGLKPGPRRTASSVVGIHSCVVVTTEIVLSREICTWQSQNGTWSFLSTFLSSRCACVCVLVSAPVWVYHQASCKCEQLKMCFRQKLSFYLCEIKANRQTHLRFPVSVSVCVCVREM